MLTISCFFTSLVSRMFSARRLSLWPITVQNLFSTFFVYVPKFKSTPQHIHIIYDSKFK